MHALFGIAVWRSNTAIVLRQFKSVLLELFLAALIIWISAVGTVCLHCTKSGICWPDSFFQSILNKSSRLSYLLPEERSDHVIGKLRHPSIFRLPHVHTTRSKTSFINYALDHYIWFYLAFISKLLYVVLCCTLCCVFYYFNFNPAFGLQLSFNKVELEFWLDFLSLYLASYWKQNVPYFRRYWHGVVSASWSNLKYHDYR